MNKDYENILQKLNNKSSAVARKEIVMFLKSEAEKLKLNPDSTFQIFYEIAGLGATEFSRQLPVDDPIDEIITISGELEINPDNYEVLYQELLTKIAKL